jgi:hypothetical protein
MNKKGLLANINQAKSKLAEVMRIGMKKRKQAYDALYEDGNTCALGAAMEGQHILDNPDLAATDHARWLEARRGEINYLHEHGHREELKYKTHSPAAPDRYVRTVSDIIIDLNDNERWSRGRIARWLDKVAQERSANGK